MKSKKKIGMDRMKCACANQSVNFEVHVEAVDLPVDASLAETC